MFPSEWYEFPSAPCLTVCVSMLLKSRASLSSFRTCFLPGRAKDVSAPGITLSGSFFLIASRQTLSASVYFHRPQHIAILQDFCRSYNAICYMRFLVKLLLLAVVVALAYSNNVTAVLSLSLDMCYGKRTPWSSG